MRLATVFVRYYKSFNFDYLRKFHPKSRASPWEDEPWYPYVKVPIDREITTVVGANESGKTHLLTAIEKGITGEGIDFEDFCRYSPFFNVASGKFLCPDFGFEWDDLSDADRTVLGQVCGLPTPPDTARFYYFRSNKSTQHVYFPKGDDAVRFELDHAAGKLLIESIPTVFRLNEKVALPASVPIQFLASDTTSPEDDPLALLGRSLRGELLDALTATRQNRGWFESPQSITQSAASIHPFFAELLARLDNLGSVETAQDTRAGYRLAKELIRKVANIDPAALLSLQKAIRAGKDGFANGIIQQINAELDAALNFPNVWVQDKDFRLIVSPRDHDLAFTIRDRTGTEYSFTERSHGLRYFLSYYIQYLAHMPSRGDSEILLMDEPDAFLSSQAQQDLLRVFESFANSPIGRPPVQVVYVTHSPFLIDKNHAHRIRVLEKGVGSEGTRVVRDASRNHYEPLRSAFGAYVAETTFIGNCNLMVEGPADQVLLAGASRHLRLQNAPNMDNLDLNRLTIVPAGSASHIPYLVYLARGRDIDRPAVIVLLDGDAEGNEAHKGLTETPAERRLIRPDFVIQVPVVATNDHPILETEDLVPGFLAVEATRRYLRTVCGVPEGWDEKVSAEKIDGLRSSGLTQFKAICKLLKDTGSGYHIEKIGFGREVIEFVDELREKADRTSDESAALAEFERRMGELFSRLTYAQRQAERELASDRLSSRVERAKKSFLRDCPRAARKEQAVLMLENIEASLDDSLESDTVRTSIQAMRRDFDLATDRAALIPRYDEFKNRLEALRYTGRIATQDRGFEQELRPSKRRPRETSNDPSNVLTLSTSPETPDSPPGNGLPQDE